MSRLASWLVAVVLLSAASPAVQAQLVADGETNILDGVIVNGLDDVTIGTNAPFTWLVLTNAAAVTNSGNVYLGYHVSSRSNRLALAGAGTTWNSRYPLHVGWVGACNEFDLSDGALMISYSDGYLGGTLYSSNNLAVISGPGSTWSVNDFSIGSGAGNRLVVTNGGRLLDSYAQIGDFNSASNSLATVVGTNSLWSTRNYLYVGGYSSFNQLDVLDGALVCAADGYIGYNGLASNNTVRVSAGTWSNTTTHVGYSSTGNQLIITNGGGVMNNSGYVGQNTSSTNSTGNNTVLVTGTGSVWQCLGGLLLGYSGPANQLIITNGGSVTNNSGYVGWDISSSNNTAIVTDTGSVWQCQSVLSLGYSGPANQLIITNGGWVIMKANGYVGYNASGMSNKMFVSGTGSVCGCGSTLFVGYNSTGNQLIVSHGGTLTARSLSIGNTTPNASNRLVVAGGNVVVTNTLNVNYGRLTLNSGLLNAAFLTLSNGGQPEIAFNGGTMQIRSTTATATPFTIGDGTNAALFEMLLNDTHTFPGGLILRSNATLKGLGSITGSVTNQSGGTISPGSSVGQISITANLLFASGSTNVMELNANTGASAAIVGMTNVTYHGTLQLTNLAGNLADGNSFTLFSASNYSGAFDAVLPHTPGPGLRWNLDRLTVDGVLQVVTKTSSPPPLISGTSVSANKLVIYGGNGVPYDPCVLLSSTNLAAGAAAWLPSATNYFDGYGNVVFSNPISLAEPGRYFRLQVE